MTTEHYEKLDESHLILRDWLAVDRTVLANERTLLAYVRTALALSAAGATFVHFFHGRATVAVGWFLMPAGLLTLGFGFWRYFQVRRSIAAVGKRPDRSAVQTPPESPSLLGVKPEQVQASEQGSSQST